MTRLAALMISALILLPISPLHAQSLCQQFNAADAEKKTSLLELTKFRTSEPRESYCLALRRHRSATEAVTAFFYKSGIEQCFKAATDVGVLRADMEQSATRNRELERRECGSAR